jgi:hypothetical protein
MHICSILLLIIISSLFAIINLFVCTPLLHNAVTSSRSHTGLDVCFCGFSADSLPSAVNIEEGNCAPTLPYLIKYSFISKMGHLEIR